MGPWWGALLPNLEPFVSSVLIPAMDGPSTTGDAAADADAAAAGAASAAPAQSAAEREVERREAQRLFGVLAEAAGGAMYDRLIGLLADKLPDHVVMRRGPQLDEKAALVARARMLVRQRPLRVQLQVVAQGGSSGGRRSGGSRRSGASRRCCLTAGRMMRM